MIEILTFDRLRIIIRSPIFKGQLNDPVDDCLLSRVHRTVDLNAF